MSLAIHWGDDNNLDSSGFIFFNAVTSYTQNNRGQVTKHPVDTGGNITDHFIKDNPQFAFSGVISGVEIGTGLTQVVDSGGYIPFNLSDADTNAVSVNSTDSSVLKKFIPDSVGQFISDQTPTVVMDGARIDLLEQVREMLVNLMQGIIYNETTSQFDPNIQLIKLYEYDGINLKKVINNLVLTSLNFKEDSNSGYGLYCDLSFEQVTFASLKKKAIPSNITATLSKKSASKSNKGKADSTPDTDTPPKDTDGLREGRENG